MSYVSTRNSIVAEIERAKAAWTAYTLAIEYDNKGVVDLASQVNPYLAVDIVDQDGFQLDLGTRPQVRDSGQIMIAAGVKEGAGTVGLKALLDHFRPYLQLRTNLGAVRTAEAKMQSMPVRRLGFYYRTMIITFWTDEVAPTVP